MLITEASTSKMYFLFFLVKYFFNYLFFTWIMTISYILFGLEIHTLAKSMFGPNFASSTHLVEAIGRSNIFFLDITTNLNYYSNYLGMSFEMRIKPWKVVQQEDGLHDILAKFF